MVDADVSLVGQEQREAFGDPDLTRVVSSARTN
jgi:hypothetical protein